LSLSATANDVKATSRWASGTNAFGGIVSPRPQQTEVFIL